MVKLLDPLHSGEARGKLGDQVFGTHRGVRFVRTFTAPTFSDPDPRAAQQARVAAANAAWQTLSDSQRSLWSDYANRNTRPDWTGRDIRISGYASFISLHTVCAVAGGTPLDEPPATIKPYPPTSLTLTQTDNDVEVAWTYPSQPEAHTYKLRIWRNGPISTGRMPDFHHASTIAIVAINSSPYTDSLSQSGRYGYWIDVIDATTGET